jgi:hypothetical protein
MLYSWIQRKPSTQHSTLTYLYKLPELGFRQVSLSLFLLFSLRTLVETELFTPRKIPAGGPPYPNIVQSIHINDTLRPILLCSRTMYVFTRLQTSTRPHCSEFVVV